MVDMNIVSIAPKVVPTGAGIEYGILVRRATSELTMHWGVGPEAARQASVTGEVEWEGEWLTVYEVRSRPIDPPQTVLWQSKECPWAA